MNFDNLLTYDELQKLLDDNQYLITAAEVQGLLMGFYSAGLALDSIAWQQQLLKQLSIPMPMVAVIENELTKMNAMLCEMITDDIFGLNLFLPDDSSTTTVRGEALGYWCQGFLLGYMQLTENTDEEDDDVSDALTDLEEISNIDLDSIGSSEEDEKALFEISEHIKVSAQLIHSVYGQSPEKSNKTIH